MSLKPMRTCSGLPALHPSGKPLMMESPCPWVPWTWAPDDAGFPDYHAILSPNPGMVLAVSFRSDVGSFSGRSSLSSRIVWPCGSGGLSVSAAFSSPFPDEMYADVRAGTGATVRLSQAAGLGPVALDGFFFRFALSARVQGAAGDLATLTFSWT